MQKPDHRHRRLLRPRREGPSRRNTTKKCDEFPSPHGFTRAEDDVGYEKSITSSGSRIVPFVTAQAGQRMSALGQKQTFRVACSFCTTD
jgi:hypothetical protein